MIYTNHRFLTDPLNSVLEFRICLVFTGTHFVNCEIECYTEILEKKTFNVLLWLLNKSTVYNWDYTAIRARHNQRNKSMYISHNLKLQRNEMH